jgi:para-nitrobenzyl esterase
MRAGQLPLSLRPRAEGPRALKRSPSASPFLTAAALSFVISAIGCAPETPDPTKVKPTPAPVGDAGLSTGGGSATALDGGGSLDGGGGASGTVELTVAEGKISGKVSGKTRLFLGIPYAEPPVGELRFAPPKPAKAWTKTLAATEFGASCPQGMGGLSATNEKAEDCLTLNVYAPTGGKKLPVMFWIHGGAFISGGSSQYDGTRLSAEGPVVVVTVNYRLGALGFLSHPALDEARGDMPSGNDGLRDQQLAMTWVKKNIAAFGGDPDNVTVMGESAGGASACMQIVSPTAKGLAKRFIVESGSCAGGIPIYTKETANATGDKLASELCADEDDVLACLRGKDADEVINWGADAGLFGAGWGPTVSEGDDVLPDKPLNLITAGDFNKGEVLLGTNKNEWALFVTLAPPTPAITTVATLNAAIEKQFGAAGGAAIEKHYAATDATAANTWVKLMTDGTFRCPARQLARALSEAGSKVFLYSFEEGPAMHAFEIPYVFGNPNAQLAAATLVEGTREAIQSYWRQFAKAGDPNLDGQPEWPAFDTAGDQHMTLVAEPAAGSMLSTADCDFWEMLSKAAP